MKLMEEFQQAGNALKLASGIQELLCATKRITQFMLGFFWRYSSVW
jgi:hypothetical protein